MFKLEAALRRNNTTLKDFIQKNKLTSFKFLLEFCEQRGLIPCSEIEYNKVIENVKKSKQKSSRKAGSTQKKRKSRTSSKRKRNTQTIPKSNDNGKN